MTLVDHRSVSMNVFSHTKQGHIWFEVEIRTVFEILGLL